MAECRRHGLIIHKGIDEHRQTEHVDAGSAPEKQSIALFRQQFAADCLQAEQLQRHRNHHNGGKFHYYQDAEHHRLVGSDIIGGQYLRFIENYQQKSHQQHKEEVGHQYSLYLFDIHLFLLIKWCSVQDTSTQRHFIGIFQFISHGNAPGYDRELHGIVGKLARDIEIGGIALHRTA